MIGRRLGRFVVTDGLGEGAFSQVFRARHTSGVEVAIKVARSVGDAELTRREAIQLAGFDHPGIVHAYDQGVVDGRPWLALELAQGTLSDLQTPLPLVGLAHHLLAALAHLHAHGLVHRDIKPSNILVGCTPRTGLSAADRAGVRLADFGISWQSGQAGYSRAGTPGWAAPEQLRGEVGPAADLFAVARVLRAVADAGGRRGLEPWFARALAPDTDERFPSAAHARAALPEVSGATSVVVALPGDGAGTQILERTPTPLETETRPVLLALSPLVLEASPAPIVRPSWPDIPPVPVARVARPRMLDVGLALLAHRPVLPIGRLDLLAGLWRRLREGPVSLSGAPEDVAEVEHTLLRWGEEAGVEPVIRRADDGTSVPPLAPWMVESRAQALGFDDTSARRLAMACPSDPLLRALLRELADANLLEATDEGLRIVGAVGPLRAVEGEVHQALQEAWWTGDTLHMARLLAHVPEADEGERGMLHRARLEKRQDAPSGNRLLAAARRVAERGEHDLADALSVEAAGLFVRGKNVAAARDALSSVRGTAAPRSKATAVLYEGFVAFMERDLETATARFQQVLPMVGGRYEALAKSSLADVAIHRGEPDRALELAREAQAAVGPERAEEVVATCCTVVLCLVALGAPEDQILAELERGEAATSRVTNRSSIARLTLFKAQSAMRRKEWDLADRLFLRARRLLEASGGSAVFAVLNHGLVGLERGDLASIGAITPASWAAETEVAPAYMRPLMLLHTLYAALGEADEQSIDAAFVALQGVTLPPVTREGLTRAAELVPARAEQLLALCG